MVALCVAVTLWRQNLTICVCSGDSLNDKFLLILWPRKTIKVEQLQQRKRKFLFSFNYFLTKVFKKINLGQGWMQLFTRGGKTSLPLSPLLLDSRFFKLVLRGLCGSILSSHGTICGWHKYKVKNKHYRYHNCSPLILFQVLLMRY